MSPDGVAILQKPSIENDTKFVNEAEVENKIVFVCVEIKTHVSETTITYANKVLENHGRLVTCCYEDYTFHDYVPLNNQHQAIHQACT